MKSILLLALLAGSLVSEAQTTVISVGSSPTLLIKNGTTFSADSLVLIPGADFPFGSNTIQVSPVAVNISPNPTIKRVYNLASQVTFTGTIQLYYQLSELNGNTESQLKYTDSATSAAWITQLASSVNTVSHFVQYTASAKAFIAATASQSNVVLAIRLVSFTANWDREMPVLTWVADQTGESVSFDVESSTDGIDWKKTGEVNGDQNSSLSTYTYNDNNTSGSVMYYRIRLVQLSGQSIYSYVVKVQKGDNNNNVRLIAGNNRLSVRFIGNLPAGIRLINAAGQQVRADMTSRPTYEISGLTPGVYFLQYEIQGQWLAREAVVW